MPLVKQNPSPSATAQYDKRFGFLHPSVNRRVPDLEARAAAAVKSGKPDPLLQEYRASKYPKSPESKSALLSGSPDY